MAAVVLGYAVGLVINAAASVRLQKAAEFLIAASEFFLTSCSKDAVDSFLSSSQEIRIAPLFHPPGPTAKSQYYCSLSPRF
jgi:hypothetical protein